MKPDLSVIFLSTAAGAGYGLLALLGLGHMVHDWGFGLLAMLLSLMLISMGLARSRSVQWRVVGPDRRLVGAAGASIQRRGALATLTLLAMTVYGVIWVFFEPLPPAWLGWLTSALAGLTVLWSAIRALPAAQAGRRLYLAGDHLAFAWMSGSLFYLMLVGFFRGDVDWALRNAMLALVAAWGLTLVHWRVIDRSRGTQDDGVAELEPPSGGGDPGQDMVYAIARRLGGRLRSVAVACGGIVPLAVLALAYGIDHPTLTGLLAGIAALSAYPGVLIARWLVFADASDTVAVTWRRQ